MEIEPEWLSCILWTDEAHFTLNGGVNIQNFRIWSTHNPHEIVQKELPEKKVTTGAVSQVIFDVSVTVTNNTGRRYEIMPFHEYKTKEIKTLSLCRTEHIIYRPLKELLTADISSPFLLKI